MPTLTVTPDENGRVSVGGVHIHKDDIVAMLAPSNLNDAATGGGIRLQDGRVRVLLPVQGIEHAMAGYTLAFTVVRDAVTEGEKVAIETKKAGTEARKLKIAADAEAERKRLIEAKDAESAKIVSAVKEMAVAGNKQTSEALASAFSSLVASSR